MKRTSRAGFTIVEMAISATLLAGLLAGVIALTLAGSGAFRAGTSKIDLETRVHVALDRMAHEIGNAGRGSLFPNPQPVPGIQGLGTSTLDFQACVGTAGKVPLFGPVQRLALELEPSELDNGLDDDADGLVDEGLVTWTTDLGGPSPRRAVLATGVGELLEGELANGADDNGNGLVDEPGLAFQLIGERVNVWLTLERSVDGNLLTYTAQRSIAFRNK